MICVRLFANVPTGSTFGAVLELLFFSKRNFDFAGVAGASVDTGLLSVVTFSSVLRTGVDDFTDNSAAIFARLATSSDPLIRTGLFGSA